MRKPKYMPRFRAEVRARVILEHLYALSPRLWFSADVDREVRAIVERQVHLELRCCLAAMKRKARKG